MTIPTNREFTMKKTIIMGLVALFAMTSQAGIQSQIATLGKRVNTLETNYPIPTTPFDYIKFNTAAAAAPGEDGAGGVYEAGKISWDEVHGTLLVDSGFNGVRNSVGMENWIRFYNDTGVTIEDGKVINAMGAHSPTETLKGYLADASTGFGSSAILGVSTADVAPGQVGIATILGEVHGLDTSALPVNGPLYLDPANPGDFTQTRPTYPENIVILGSVVVQDASDGVVFVKPTTFLRYDASKSYTFGSKDLPGGLGQVYYKAGFYDWSVNSAVYAAQDITTPLVSHGTANQVYAAHVGIVPSAAGTYTGSSIIGLKVVADGATSCQDFTDGTLQAAGDGIIIEDIKNLTADVLAETVEYFSGDIEFQFYESTPGDTTTATLSFNYGYSKYEDMNDRKITLVGFEAQWIGKQDANTLDIAVKHHTPTGWNYSAAAFVAGNGDVCRKSVDQAICSMVNDKRQGGYKREEINLVIDGANNEGLLIELIPSSDKTAQTLDLHLIAKSEQLDR